LSLQPPSSKHHPQSQPNPPQSLKASNYNYHWAPLYLTNNLESTTWNNNQKQDAKMTLLLINDATSCMPSSQSKMMNSHPKTTTSHPNCYPMWDKPSYATFTNPFKITPPDSYVENNPLKIPPKIQKKKLDPTFTKYFEKLTQANQILY